MVKDTPDMRWLYRGKTITTLADMPMSATGFVYIITRNEKFYIGKKTLYFKKTMPPLKGRVNKRRIRVESDWANYWGSSENLLKDIKIHGAHQFTREIIEYHETKGSLSYAEAKMQFQMNAIYDKDCYNQIINVRLRNHK